MKALFTIAIIITGIGVLWCISTIVRIAIKHKVVKDKLQ